VRCALAEPLELADDPPQQADADAELVERFRGGERSAFDLLVRRHQRAIYFLVLRYLRREADAADVTQRTFVRALQSIGSFCGQASLRTWLYRIAINLALNHLRDHRREHPGEIDDDALAAEPTGLARMLDAESTAALRAAVATLPAKQRLVLELRVYDELPFREVAAIADCTENAAKVNFHHAVKGLRARLAGAR
jgi:RNA polymerase sigma-70 factor (ECF subfamily)